MRGYLHRGLLIVLLSVSLFTVLHGTETETVIVQARQFTTHNGLSNNEVTEIAQDKRGYIWIGTQNGLNRFNGYDFDIFRMGMPDRRALPGNNITAMYIDKQDSLWIGSDGLSLYIPETGKFRNWHHTPGDSMNLTDSYVNSITNDEHGRIWLASYFGIRILEKSTGRFTSLIREEEIRVNPATIEALLRAGAPVRVISRGAGLLENAFTDEQALRNALFQDNNYQSDEEYFNLIISESLRSWNENSLKSNHVVKLAQGAGNIIWIVYGHESISSIDTRTMEIVHYDNIVNPTGMAVDQINHILVDGENLWIATSGEGLKVLNTGTELIRDIELDGEPYIQHLRKEGRRLYIADNMGVVIMDLHTEEFRRMGFLIPNQGTISNFIAKYTFRDIQNNLWIGTHYTGVLLSVSQRNFRMVKNSIIPPVGNPENAVSAISIGENDDIWTGYVKGHIEVYDRSLEKKIIVDRPGYQPAQSTDVFGIFTGMENQVWIGSFTGGAEVYDANGIRQKVFRHDPDVSGGLPGNDIRAITGDRSGNIYLALHGNGLAIYDTLGRFEILRSDPSDDNSLISDWTQTLLYDNAGQIWIGTVDGLSRYSIDRKSLKNFRFEGFPRSLINIRCITRDSRGLLWLGTEFGVLIFNPVSEDYFRLADHEGLSSNIIAAIIEDDSGNIWISTRIGLNRLEIPGNTNDLVGFMKSSGSGEIRELVTHYGLADGLLTEVFSYRASAKSEDGHIFFGSTAGIVWFHPDSLEINKFVPPVIISRLNLFNREILIGDETGILESDISHTGKIVLKYSQRVIGFEFHALNYIFPEKNRYAYKMEGFDNNWIYVTGQRAATYTNLNPGTYTFRVRAANNSGIWNNDGTRIEIVIRPPLWRTNTAYLIYALMIVSMIYLLRQIMTIRTHARMEVRKAKEIDEIKTSFFTDVSHEFRTPLTLMEGPVEKLIREKGSFDWNKDYYQVNLVYRNVQRLKLLITELMEFRKLTEGRRDLKIQKGDLSALVYDIKNAFDYLADEKKIDFIIELSHESIITFFDPGIIEKILFNLLSNAFKFTPEGGSVKIRMQFKKQSDEIISEFYAKDYIRFEVSDTGPGIPGEIKDKIFERFYQLESKPGKTEGSGIGLALVKELVALHKGDVVLNPPKSEINRKGTSFVIKIPFGEDYYHGKITGQLFEGADKNALLKKTVALTTIKKFTGPGEAAGNGRDKTILIVEDEDEIRQYLNNELQEQYRILSPPTTKEALDTAFNEIPDLILSDIIMPGIDGIEFCRRIKSDLRTEHIPVILVSARSEEKDRLEGLETGADDFIIKPFIMEELKLRIKNCINARVKLRQKFLKDFTSPPRLAGDYSAEDRFISKALKIVNDNISSPDLDVDFFASEIGMSRAQLYRKFNALTNQTVKEFVRTVRLKKAAEMLESGKFNVSEVAYAVGFGDLPYFTRSFKAQFGINPSRYQHRDSVNRNS